MNRTVLPWWRMQPSEKTGMPIDNTRYRHRAKTWGAGRNLRFQIGSWHPVFLLNAT